MLRIFLPMMIILSLAACDQKMAPSGKSRLASPGAASSQSYVSEMSGSAASDQPSFDRPGLAYTHRLALEMPAASVEARYDRAVEACSKAFDQGCVVLNASINQGDQSDYEQPSAQLSVRLPHAIIAGFRASLVAPLPGQTDSDASIVSQSTNGEDLTKQISDVDQKASQLADYRERLLALSKRPDAKVDDLIKIENELSSVQSQIEAIAAQKSGLSERVATELLTVAFSSRPDAKGATGPIAKAWSRGGRTLGESAAEALAFSISALPWLPVIGIALFLVRLVVRRRRPQ